MSARYFLFSAGLAWLLVAQQGVDPEELQLRSTDYRPPAAYTLRVQAELVDIGVVVRDSQGHSIGGLGAGDFDVEDAGKKRKITAFSAETSTTRSAPAAPIAPAAPKAEATAPPAGATPKPPRFLGLLFDDFSIDASDLPPTKTAAKRFIQHSLESGDQVAIFSLSKLMVLPFSDDVAKLNDAIDRLNISSRKPGGGDACPTMTPYEGYLIANHQDTNLLEIKAQEAIGCGACPVPPALRGRPASGSQLRSCEEHVVYPMGQSIWEQVRDTSLRSLDAMDHIVDYLGSMPGGRVLVLASSGFLAQTLERQQDDLANHALHAGVVINALDARGLYTQDFLTIPRGADVRAVNRLLLLGTAPKSAAGDPLSFLAAATGGLFFHNNNDIELGFRELGMVPEFSYSLGIAPADPPDNRFHRLNVRLTKAGGNSVQARLGYYAAAKSAGPPPAERRVDQEIQSAGSFNELPVRITGSPARTQAGQPGLRVVLHLDMQKLRFDNRAGIRNQKVTWIAALFDENGIFVVGREAAVEFRLKEATFQRMADGFEGGLTLAALPGKYRLRTVVEDGLDSKVTASSQPVEIR